MSKYTGVVISDIHFGISKSENLYNELNSIFIENIKNMKQLDFIIIDGDYFDKKIYMNDMSAYYAMDMMKKISDICRKRDIKLRIVYGTESHESDQYKIFDSMLIDIDWKLVKTVSDEYLFPDLKVLYIPEEYIYDRWKYYEDYFNRIDEYDYVFGHGVVNDIMCAIKDNSHNTVNRKAPVFKAGELTKICKGQLYFGHYHINSQIDDKFFYVGSYTRWCFGEEEDKGYYEIYCDTDKEKYTNKFIVNTMCETYTTISFEYKKLIDSDAMYETLKTADELLKNKVYNNVRFMFNIPEDAVNPEYMIEVIRNKYNNMKNIKCEVTNGYIKKETKRKKSAFRESYEHFKYIFDKSLDTADKIHRFISVEYHYDMDREKIKKYLNDPIDKLIGKNTDDSIE